VVQEDWDITREVACFQELDIGVYPLPKARWVLGKTGFKTVQYMSVGVPCVVSNIGRNQEIVTDGANGFLADSEDEWVDKLSRLVEDTALRERLGQAGRRTVEAGFSMQSHIQTYREIYQGTAGLEGRPRPLKKAHSAPVRSKKPRDRIEVREGT